MGGAVGESTFGDPCFERRLHKKRIKGRSDKVASEVVQNLPGLNKLIRNAQDNASRRGRQPFDPLIAKSFLKFNAIRRVLLALPVKDNEFIAPKHERRSLGVQPGKSAKHLLEAKMCVST